MKIKIALFLIILVAFFLRVFRLGIVPPSLYWDEASLGYNAYAIYTTGFDEHGEKFPLARFTAFGDYKPPGYIYSIIPFLYFFGLNEISVRLPSALAGTMMVFLTYILVNLLFKNKIGGLFAALLLTISPWGLQLSRAAFEANLAAMFNLAAVILFLYGLKKSWSLPLSILLFTLSFYTFNANRIIAPLFILLFIVIYRNDLVKKIKWLVIGLLIGVILLIPSMSYLQSRESRLRFNEVSIFTSLDIIKKSNSRIERDGATWWAKLIHNRRIYFFREFLIHYLDNFKPSFLFVQGDRNPRLSIQELGELYIFELPFILSGLYFLLKQKKKSSAILIGWMFLAVIPAGTARETPHMLRIASILPTYQILGGLGLWQTWQWIKNKTASYKLLIFGFFTIVVALNLVYYFHNYWAHYPKNWYGEWQYGYKELVQKVSLIENNYEQIFITSNLGRPYIYFLFYNRVNPLVYLQTRQAERDWYGLWNVYGYGKYIFDKKYLNAESKILKVESPGSFANQGQKLDEVLGPDGKVIFEIGTQ